jgi:septum formation protein
VKQRQKIEPVWILASESPRRSEILDRLGIRFRVEPSGISEPARKPGEAPSRYAVRIARLKANEVAKRHKTGFILSADTIVVLHNKILLKPENRADARAILGNLSGKWHEVISGLCLLDRKLRRSYSASMSSRVHFRRLSSAEIEWYLNTGEYQDKAGAYGIQGCASLFVDRIEGCYFNVVGFPIASFELLCRKAGINLLRTITPGR